MILTRRLLLKPQSIKSLLCKARHISSIGTMAAQETAKEIQTPTYSPRYIDIGINLADSVYRGHYRGKQKHPDDLDAVVDRAKQVGCTKLIVTGSDWHSIQGGQDLAKEHPGIIYYTAGIHPCSSSIFGVGRADTDDHTPSCDPDPAATAPPTPEDTVDPAKSKSIIARLRDTVAAAAAAASTSTATGQRQLVAIGEIGLDYDRLHFCGRTVQLHSFAEQLRLAAALEPPLPLFLHSRAAGPDFAALLRDAFGPRLERLVRGAVVHSFTGSLEEMRELIDLGLYVGVNGCSLKTDDNCAVVREMPLDRIMLETDGPWCEVRPSHAGWKYLARAAAATPTPTPAENADAVDAAAQEKLATEKTQKQPAGGKKNQKNQKTAEPEVFSRFKATKVWQQGCMVKGRNEPCTIERVAEIVAAIKGITVQEVCEAAWRNTNKVFRLDEGQ